MVGLIGITGVAFVWLWLFAPDAVSDRLRRGLMIAAALVFTVSVWSTMSMMEAHRQARQSIRLHYQRSERQKREAIDQIRRENEELIVTPPLRQ